MEKILTSDKMFLIKINATTKEGYLRRMKHFVDIPKEGKVLAIAFGYLGKQRIYNAIGYMAPIHEAASLDDIPQDYIGTYDLVALYYVSRAEGHPELQQLIQKAKSLLAEGGHIMTVTDLHDNTLTSEALRAECRQQGLLEVRRELWNSEPMNHWDSRDEEGRIASPLVKHIPMLRRMFAKTESIIFKLQQ